EPLRRAGQALASNPGARNPAPRCGEASALAARHDGERGDRVDRLAALVEGGPFDPGDALRPTARGDELDELALEMDHVARPYGREPAQLVDPDAEQRMRPERPRVGHEAHRNRRRVPAGSRKPPE